MPSGFINSQLPFVNFAFLEDKRRVLIQKYKNEAK